MTRPRFDNHSTEFGIWLRNQPIIDSKLGFVTTNVDYIWENYKTNEFMLLEEKRFGKTMRYSQENQFRRLDTIIKSSYKSLLYLGFHLIVFENTNPDDGNIYLNNKLITKSDLLSFLKFELKVMPLF